VISASHSLDRFAFVAARCQNALAGWKRAEKKKAVGLF